MIEVKPVVRQNFCKHIKWMLSQNVIIFLWFVCV